VFAKNLADKAASLAAQLAGRWFSSYSPHPYGITCLSAPLPTTWASGSHHAIFCTVLTPSSAMDQLPRVAFRLPLGW